MKADLSAARPLSGRALVPRVYEMLKKNPSRLGLFAKSRCEESYVEHGIGTDMSRKMCCHCLHQLRPLRPPGWQLVVRLVNSRVMDCHVESVVCWETAASWD